MIAFWMRQSIPNATYSRLRNAKAFLQRKQERVKEKVKKAFFGNLDIFFGISILLFLNFIDIFAATDTTSYFTKMHIVRWLIKVRTLDLKSDTMIKNLTVSKIVSFQYILKPQTTRVL